MFNRRKLFAQRATLKLRAQMKCVCRDTKYRQPSTFVQVGLSQEERKKKILHWQMFPFFSQLSNLEGRECLAMKNTVLTFSSSRQISSVLMQVLVDYYL